MTSYKVVYSRTGSVNDSKTDRVIIHTCDTLNDGRRINDIKGVIERFEELTAYWMSYETVHAIISITKIGEN